MLIEFAYNSAAHKNKRKQSRIYLPLRDPELRENQKKYGWEKNIEIARKT